MPGFIDKFGRQWRRLPFMILRLAKPLALRRGCHLGEAFGFAKAYGSFWRAEWKNRVVVSIGMRLLALTQTILLCNCPPFLHRPWNPITPHPSQRTLLSQTPVDCSLVWWQNHRRLHSNRCVIAMTSCRTKHQDCRVGKSDSPGPCTHTHPRTLTHLLQHKRFV